MPVKKSKAPSKAKSASNAKSPEFKLARPSAEQIVSGWKKILGPDLKKPALRETQQADPLEWLKKTLQSAVSLEFATIPPYLCALWSIKNETHPVARSIREIVQEEMLHMGLACNMLASIGGTPKICNPPEFVPKYPGKLPGNVHEGLIVHLSGLDKRSLETFLTIERPAEFPAEVEEDDTRPDTGQTIGQVYDCLRNAFEHLQPEMSLKNQITGPLAWRVFSSFKDIHWGIGLIQLQGEGSNKPIDPTKKPPKRHSFEWARDNLSHYYRFQEIAHGKTLVFDAKKKKYIYAGDYDQPEIWPMAPVPTGGYRQADVSPEVWHLIDKFDDTYSKLLRLLQNAWGRDESDPQAPFGQAAIIHAIDTMFQLEQYAKPLMRTPIPGKKSQNYGPCFRYKPRG